jgi:PPE-repeat protein
MMDFGALAPEVNSGRMYAGAGSGPLLAAAAAWDSLAADLQSAAASYGSMIQSLSVGPWTGPSSTAMAAAATPYVAWMTATGAQAELAASQAKIAAGAYEAAFAAMVPPPVIATNRALLAALVASNILGQNTAAIAAAETHYAEMWAQDAAGMYAYAGSSSTASALTSFTEPPPTTNAAAAVIQPAAASATPAASSVGSQLVALIESIPTWLQTLATNIAALPTQASSFLEGLAIPNYLSIPVLTTFNTNTTNLNTFFSAIASQSYSLQGLASIPGGPFLSFGQTYAYAQNGQALAAFGAPAKAAAGALAPLMGGAPAHLSSAAMGGAPVSGSMGKAALVGSMSVPQGWTEAAPGIKTLASVLPMNMADVSGVSLAGEGGVFSQMALSSLAGRALTASSFGSTTSAAAHAFGGVVAEADPAAATIIVIPALED